MKTTRRNQVSSSRDDNDIFDAEEDDYEPLEGILGPNVPLEPDPEPNDKPPQKRRLPSPEERDDDDDDMPKMHVFTKRDMETFFKPRTRKKPAN